MRVVIVADGDVDAAVLRGAVGEGSDRAFLIAADGGALKAESAGLIPDLVLGDGDSLDAGDRHRLESAGARLRLVPAEKDESDTELCLLEALALGATEIRLHGALGGVRADHGLANVALLALTQLAGVDVAIQHGAGTVRLVGDPDGPARIDLHGQPGDLLSLLPLPPGAEGVTTEGLRYALRDEALTHGPSRGLSNEFTDEQAAVSIRRGRLLVTHTTREGDSP